jgi:hypothetical protein
MPAEPERDNTTFTAGQILRSPRGAASALFFLTILVVLRMFLRISIRLNAATVCNYEFHDRAMELFYQTHALLNVRDIR